MQTQRRTGGRRSDRNRIQTQKNTENTQKQNTKYHLYTINKNTAAYRVTPGNGFRKWNWRDGVERGGITKGIN
jgi:hypothetical protein